MAWSYINASICCCSKSNLILSSWWLPFTNLVISFKSFLFSSKDFWYAASSFSFKFSSCRALFSVFNRMFSYSHSCSLSANFLFSCPNTSSSLLVFAIISYYYIIKSVELKVIKFSLISFNSLTCLPVEWVTGFCAFSIRIRHIHFALSFTLTLTGSYKSLKLIGLRRFLRVLDSLIWHRLVCLHLLINLFCAFRLFKWSARLLRIFFIGSGHHQVRPLA